MSESRHHLKRPRPSYGDSPSEVECDWGKMPPFHDLHDLHEQSLSLLDHASPAHVERHLTDLRREKLATPLVALVTKLMLHRANQNIFNAPVDPIRLACPTYFDVITHPMDLGTIKQRLTSLAYTSVDHVAADVRLVFANAVRFNPPGHVVHETAILLAKEFEREFAAYARRERDHATKRAAHSCAHCQGHVCGLCDEKCINFEPPLVLCLGKCGQRLRRGATYFTTADGDGVWCAKCVPKAKEFSLSDGRIVAKASLLKAKFQDELTEPWVQCDACQGWVHQVCALFNGEEIDDDVPFTCALCRLRPAPPTSPPTPSVHSPVVKKAKTLHRSPEPSTPTTRLADFMQAWVRSHLVSLGEAQSVADSVSVRLASSVDVTVPVTAEAQDHFRLNGCAYPASVTYTSKTILVMQAMDGADVCLFSMYVQEYGPNCGIPSNANRAYIAYLDSLGYFRPRHARTSVYQQLVLAYLGFCKARGFTHAHIWACPTTRGGDFIYWCHPAHQRNPSKDRLLLWYKAIVTAARARHVAFGLDNLWTTHFSALDSGISNAPLPPYFDGDFWPAELSRAVAAPPKKAKKPTASNHGVVLVTAARDAIKAEVYHAVRASKESLFAIPLQPTCAACARLLVNEAYWTDAAGDVACDGCVGDKDVAQRQLVPSFVTDGVDDDAVEISCPFLDRRVDLLKHCEEAHLQFDSLRRAKHSTMMLLHHMRTGTTVTPRRA